MKRTIPLIMAGAVVAVLLTWSAVSLVEANKTKKQNKETAKKSNSEDVSERLLEARAPNQKNSRIRSEPADKRESPSKPRDEGDEEEGVDPDAPGFLRRKPDEGEHLLRRAAYIARLRGVEPEQPFDIQRRIAALSDFHKQERLRDDAVKSGTLFLPEGGASWTPIGPFPIPNGQTETTVTAVSGRVTAIDVHPTNPLIAYVGTAQGGVYRTTDGGTNWTQLLNSPPPPGTGFSPAGTLAIGAVTIDPVNPTTVFVGTGEGNLSLDSLFGVGIYRIINAQTTPTVQGPFEVRTNGGGGHAFAGTGITKIIIDPFNNNNMFVGNTLGGSGMSGEGICCGGIAPISAFVGLYFSSNAQAATPTWVRLNQASLPGDGVSGVSDISIDPLDANVLVVAQLDFGSTVPSSGIFRSANALLGLGATYTKVANIAGTQTNVKFAALKPGSNPAVFYAATGESNGRLRLSTDGGATFSAAGVPAGGNGFCDGQCFYDIAIAVDPGATTATTDDILYLGGNVRGGATKLLARSDNGGATFSNVDVGLHADNHAITIAPSNKNVVYTGNDGGVWRSDNAKATPATVAWTDVNTSAFSATQFVSMDVHPVDTSFTIGGTQDNGTPCFGNCGGNTPGTWIRADFGDGGFSAIDQNATDTTNVTMYHTYFNQTNNLIGYARVDTTAAGTDGNWAFKGCNGVAGNGINCGDNVLFYAPLARGPGNPNTIYFGTDRLYRSINKGDNHTVVSQAPLSGANSISAIGISPQDDNFRIVGLENGGLFFTTTGSPTLTSLDPVGAGSGTIIPDKFIGRIVFDPTNKNTAYITLNGYTGTAAGTPSNHVWRVTNLSTTPVLTSINGIGSLFLPDIPVNAFAVDNLQPLRLLAGTDIGVYISEDGGTNWAPFGTGLPPIPVFGMAIAPGRILRVATHGLGIWQMALPAANATISGNVIYANGTTPGKNVTMTLTGPAGFTQTTTTDSSGNYSFTVPAGLGQNYTLTPTKIGDVNGVTAFDASLAARFAAGLITLTANQQIAGDASNNGSVTAFDASLIARTAAGLPNIGIAGTWKFSPVNLGFPNLSANQTSQNLTAILVGDISGNWLPASLSPPEHR